MTEHTPGKWEWTIEDCSMASLGVGDMPGNGTPLVMNVGPCRSCAERAFKAGDDWEWGRCCTPSEADARLIAAAPDLLDALEDAVGDLETFIALRAGEHKDFCDLTRYKAAIAKARGQ